MLRHRWYAGGIATLLSAALVFTGMTPAVAEDTPAPVDTTSVQEAATDPSTPPDDAPVDPTPIDQTPVDQTPVDQTPVDQTPVDQTPTDLAPDTFEVLSDEGDIGLLSIVDEMPVAQGSTTLQIKKLGSRNADGTVAPLGGATFVAYASTRGGARSGTPVAGSCQTGSDGLCEIVVPNRTGGSGGTTNGYWVYETTAPSGWGTVGNLGLGNYNSTKTSTPYSYFTNNVSGNTTIWQITQDATGYIGAGSSPTATTRTAQNGFADVRANPAFPTTCGLSIAIVFDQSTSISSSEMTSMRNAALGFVGLNGLGGTPSSVALYRFSTTASKFLSLTSIADSQVAVNTAITNTITGAGNGYTNWDDAMRKVAFNGTENYDIVLFLTDGDPTVNGTNGSNAETTIGFRNLEEGIFSANAVKDMVGPSESRTKIVAVGIGLATNSDLNLRAISGNTPNDDYFTTDFEQLNSKLREIAEQNCGGSVTVVKKTIDPDGETIDALAGGWTFTGETNGDYIETPNGNVSSLSLTTPHSGVSEGAVNFALDLTGGQSRTISITEAVNAGFTPDSVSCSGATPSGTAESFSVTVAPRAIISCTVINKAVTSKLTLKKNVAGLGGDVAPATAWTLNAGGAAGWNGATTGSATTASTAKQTVAANTTFTLSETGPTEGYTAGNWTCDSGVTVGDGNTISLGIGADVTCEITNTQQPAKLTVIKKNMGETILQGASFQLWEDVNGNGTLEPDTDEKVGATVSAGTYNWTSLAWGKYIVEEVTPPTGYDLADPAYQAVTLTAAETSTAAVLTFHNPQSLGALRITKTVNDPNGGYTGGTSKTFSGTYNCGTGYTGSFSTLTTALPVVISGIPAGRTCTVTETTPTGGLLNGSFSWGTPTYAPSSVTIQAGETATIGITNPVVQRFGALTVTKALAAVPAGFSGTFTGGWQCVLTNGPTTSGTWSVTFTNGTAAPTVYTGANTQIPLTSLCTVTEDTGALPAFADTSYTWASSVVSPSTAVQLTTLQQTASFTVTNTAQRSSLKLEKIVENPNGGTAVDTDWNQLLQATLGGAAPLTFNHDELKNVAPGTYTLSELAGPVGYTWTALACSVDGGAFTDAFHSKTVDVPAGGDVVCRFTNRDVAPELTLVKKVDNLNGVGSANASAWTLSATAAGGPNVSGNGAPATGDTASITGPVKGGSTYTLAETGGPSGYTAGAWACYVTGTQTPFPLTTGGTLVPVVGTNVTCEITNTAVPATGTVEKDEKSTTQLANGSWQIVYDVTVKNNSSTSTFFYTLTDQLQFGADITPTAATWTGATSGTFTPPLTGQQTLNGAGSLAPSASATYTVTVIATVSNAAADAATSVCGSTEPQRAFRNTATMTPSGGDPVTVEDCSQPWFPTVVKSAGTPTQNDDASWNVSYTLTVGNPNVGALGTVELEDNFPAAPSGWSYSPNSWTVAAVGAAPAPISSTYAPGTTGTIYEGPLAGTTSYTYTVSAKLVPTSLAVSPGDCAAGGGLRNSATVTSGLVVRDGADCVDITLPPVTVTKSTTDAQVQQLAIDTWQIDYTIVVENTSPTLRTVYTLTDLPQLGTGFTVESGEWLAPAPVPNTVIGLQGTPEGSHQYTFRIIASFDETVQNPELTCSPQETGAFSNLVTVTFPGGSGNDRACAQPGTPTVAKTGPAVATQTSATQWSLSYTVTVSNTSGQQLAYTATDIPADLPSGVTGTGWTATGPVIVGGGSATLTDGWTGELGHTELATGLIPNGATHTYTISQTVTLQSDVDPDDLRCTETPGQGGFWNTASVTNGIGGNDASACTTITPPTLSIVSLLPATGGSTPIWALWAAMLGIASGTGLLLGIARRRREAGTR